MELSICANYLKSTGLSDKSVENIFRLCKEAGFTAIDISPSADNWQGQVLALNSASQRYEIPIEQSHAPFNRYKKLPTDDYKYILDCAFDAAIAMNNKQIVIHGDDYRPLPGETYNMQKALERTYEFWAPYVEKAANQGVLVAIETVFEDNRSKNAPPDRFTSRLEELATLIDKFDNPYVKCCWDSGHARLAFGDDGIKSAITSLGKRIVCTHIHDNYYNHDLHLMPFQGTMDWQAHMSALREIGYNGNLTFEFAYGHLPGSLVEDFLRTAVKTGNILKQMFNQ